MCNVHRVCATNADPVKSGSKPVVVQAKTAVVQQTKGTVCASKTVTVRQQDAVVDHEDIGRVGFRNETIHVQHDGVTGSCQVGLNLRQDIVDHVVVVNFGIDRLGRVATLRRGDERNAARVVVGGGALGWFPLW